MADYRDGCRFRRIGIVLLVGALLVSAVPAGIGTVAASTQDASSVEADAVSAVGPEGGLAQADENNTTEAQAIGTAEVSKGDNLTMITFEVPTTVQEINSSTVRIENAAGESIEPVGSFHTDTEFTSTFSTSDLEGLAADSETLTLYANYVDSEVGVLRAQAQARERAFMEVAT